MNIYIKSLQLALPRLLSNFNMDETSSQFGVGDRFHWGWKLIDFPNGTFQAAVHGLAIMIVLKALPNSISEAGLLRRMNYMITGLRNIISKNGSLDEALPAESSFCVTALVASDILAAKHLLQDKLSLNDQEKWIKSVCPLIKFLKKQDEYHGLISNHLASAALAMFRWHALTNDHEAENRGKQWLDRILRHQSSHEGWFSEYGGSDPGYQSWCTTQLAQLHHLRPDLNLIEPLAASLKFLSYSAHPDYSFGGSYGWRNTRFLLPGGINLLADENKYAAALASFSQVGIEKHTFVTLDCIDAGNLIPFFNDYALAALALSRQKIEHGNMSLLPCFSMCGRIWLPESGWLIDGGKRHYTIINLRRGGACIHFQEDKKRYDNPSTVVQHKNGMISSSQLMPAMLYDKLDFTEDSFVIEFPLARVKRPKPSAFDFVVLRLLSMTLFRSIFLGNKIKRFLSWYLIKRKPKIVGSVVKQFILRDDLVIKEKVIGLSNVKILKNTRHFSAFHMASQGYWQVGDDDLFEGER